MQAGIELIVLLPQPSECWGCEFAPLHPAHLTFLIVTVTKGVSQKEFENKLLDKSQTPGTFLLEATTA